MIQELLAGSSERCLHPSFLLEGCECIGMVPTAPRGGWCRSAWGYWCDVGLDWGHSTLAVLSSCQRSLLG